MTFSQNYLELEQARTLSTHISDLASEFMGAYELSHVWVSKYYFDGRFFDITNDISWKEIMVSQNYYRDFVKLCLAPLEINSLKPRFLTWQTLMSSNETFPDRVYHHGIRSEFNLITIHDDHIENYGFGSTKEVMQFHNKLPSLKELEMLCLYLREGILKISPSMKNPIMGNIGHPCNLARPKGDYSNIPIPPYFSFTCNQLDSKLSRREIICLGLLARGYSNKHSAYLMNISPRTIDFHLNRIKSKFDNTSKSHLISAFHNSPLATIDPLMLLATTE